MSGPIFVCHGCAATLDSARVLPFACPNAGRDNEDTDHVLVAADGGGAIAEAQADPFLRYRAMLSPYRLGRLVGLSDDAWAEIVRTLEDRLIAVDGRAFRMTPMVPQPALAKALAMSGSLWVKDETGNVAGSHKGRHLMGVMLYLRILEAGKLPAAAGLRARQLAIASCGNAALAAAAIARAAEWPLDVYIPRDANNAVVKRLKDLGAVTRSATAGRARPPILACAVFGRRCAAARSPSACKVRTTAWRSKGRALWDSKWRKALPPVGERRMPCSSRSAAVRLLAPLPKALQWQVNFFRCRACHG